MTTRAGLFTGCLCLHAALLASDAGAHSGGFTALTLPTDAIVVDGALDDWPDDLPTYRIESVLKGFPGYDGDDPEPADLTARFRTAWSPEAQRLFVAVEVVDDRIVLGSGPTGTDAVEVYVDGSNGARDPQQYLMFPGDGSYAAFGGTTNPYLNGDDLDAAGGQGAWAVRGDTIVYEWSLQAFAERPGPPLHLAARQRIGFDVVAVDKDDSGSGATWLSWSPEGGKGSNPDRLGDLYLLSSPKAVADMVRVRGRVLRTGTDTGWRGMRIDARDASDEIWASAVTGPEGAFELWCPPGTVTLRLPESDASVDLLLTAGEHRDDVHLSVLHRTGVVLPVWPFAITLGLFGVASLGAMVPLRRRLALIGGAVAAPRATFAHLARQPEWTAPAALAVLAAALASVASINQYPGQLWGALVGMPGALSTILLLVVPLMMFLAFVVLQIAVWMAWTFLLWVAAELAGGHGRFFHLVSATGYAGLPALLGLCVTGLVVAFGEPGAPPLQWTGLGGLALAAGPLAHVLEQVELFALWSWGLAAVGVAHVMGLRPPRAAAVTAAAWIATLVLVYGFHAATRAIAAGLAGGR